MKFLRARFRGFTLIELMVSMAIGTLILLAAASVLSASGDGYERVGGGIGAEREARAVLSQLKADLSHAEFHEESVFVNETNGWSKDRIGFFSLQPEDAQAQASCVGDLCAVNYYVADQRIQGKTVRCLMRGFRDSRPTLLALREGEIRQLFDPDLNRDEPVAFGVVCFRAIPKKQSINGVWIDWGLSKEENPPEAIDVQLTLARRDLSKRLFTAPDWDRAGGVHDSIDKSHPGSQDKNLESYGALIRFGHHEAFKR